MLQVSCAFACAWQVSGTLLHNHNDVGKVYALYSKQHHEVLHDIVGYTTTRYITTHIDSKTQLFMEAEGASGFNHFGTFIWLRVPYCCIDTLLKRTRNANRSKHTMPKLGPCMPHLNVQRMAPLWARQPCWLSLEFGWSLISKAAKASKRL